MPPPSTDSMKKLARQRFRDFGLVLPMDWRAPRGSAASQHFQNAFDPEEHDVKPEPAECLFRSATRNKLHVAAAVDISELIGEFLDGICVAVCKAWSTWQSQATMSEIIVNGPIASGGRLSGPGWADVIRQHAPKAHAIQQRYSETIAKVLGQSWQQYEATVKMPSLPLFPSLAIVFGAAPPTPNLPTPIGTFVQVTQMLSTKAQTAKLCADFREPGAHHHAEIFESIAYAVEHSFLRWQSETQATKIVAKGPASPLGGPVVGGSASMSAGGLV